MDRKTFLYMADLNMQCKSSQIVYFLYQRSLGTCECRTQSKLHFTRFLRNISLFFHSSQSFIRDAHTQCLLIDRMEKENWEKWQKNTICHSMNRKCCLTKWIKWTQKEKKTHFSEISVHEYQLGTTGRIVIASTRQNRWNFFYV